MLTFRYLLSTYLFVYLSISFFVYVYRYTYLCMHLMIVFFLIYYINVYDAIFFPSPNLFFWFTLLLHSILNPEVFISPLFCFCFPLFIFYSAKSNPLNTQICFNLFPLYHIHIWTWSLHFNILQIIILTVRSSFAKLLIVDLYLAIWVTNVFLILFCLFCIVSVNKICLLDLIFLDILMQNVSLIQKLCLYCVRKKFFSDIRKHICFCTVIK